MRGGCGLLAASPERTRLKAASPPRRPTGFGAVFSPLATAGGVEPVVNGPDGHAPLAAPEEKRLRPEDNPFPIEYEIDWVRLWQGKGEDIFPFSESSARRP